MSDMEKKVLKVGKSFTHVIDPKEYMKCGVSFLEELGLGGYNCIGRHNLLEEELRKRNSEELDREFFQKDGLSVKYLEAYPGFMHFDYHDYANRLRNHYTDVHKFIYGGNEVIQDGNRLKIVNENHIYPFENHPIFHCLRTNIPANIHFGFIYEGIMYCHPNDPLTRFKFSDWCKLPVYVVHRNEELDYLGMSFCMASEYVIREKGEGEGDFVPKKFRITSDIVMFAPTYGFGDGVETKVFEEKLLVNQTYDSRHIFLRDLPGNNGRYTKFVKNESGHKSSTEEYIDVFRSNREENEFSRMIIEKNELVEETIWEQYVRHLKTEGEENGFKKSRFYVKTMLLVPEHRSYPTFVTSFREKTVDEIFEGCMELVREKLGEGNEVKYRAFAVLEGKSFIFGSVERKKSDDDDDNSEFFKYTYFNDSGIDSGENSSRRAPKSKFVICFLPK